MSLFEGIGLGVCLMYILCVICVGAGGPLLDGCLVLEVTSVFESERLSMLPME